ncbi:MAG: preprotein translocase subunit YajC [Mariprofundus sp.]|nr:preprotein translocase subunit YajC [Mariprofundus sp.]
MKTCYSSIIASVAAAMAVITPAYAEAAPSDGVGGGFASLIPLVLIMVIFYFLLIRPQQKKLKEHRSLVEQLKKGDTIITGGGLYAKVIDVKDDTLKVEIADGVRIKVKRDTIAGLSD